ncbi:unnamed protein product [Lymnaea stagnalis]|uniref:Uncharacterized protein n=1 Tax=Lymnaea stagnalis TaxID=6523 RepID=A0AAV2HXL4_LYMST
MRNLKSARQRLYRLFFYMFSVAAVNLVLEKWDSSRARQALLLCRSLVANFMACIAKGDYNTSSLVLKNQLSVVLLQLLRHFLLASLNCRCPHRLSSSPTSQTKERGSLNKADLTITDSISSLGKEDRK